MNFEKIQDQLFDATKSQNQIIFQETLALSKLKNTWIAQIVTVSGTILGGVSVFSENKNIATINSIYNNSYWTNLNNSKPTKREQ